jgi:hypothetical protein
MRSFPLMIFAVLIYNVAAFGGFVFAGEPDGMAKLLAASHPVKLFSGDVWHLTLGDTILFLGLFLLFVETIRATRTTSVEIVNHAFSMLVFIGALVEFLVVHNFATSVFFFLVLMCLFDVIAGYTISIVAAKRDLGIAPAASAE